MATTVIFYFTLSLSTVLENNITHGLFQCAREKQVPQPWFHFLLSLLFINLYFTF